MHKNKVILITGASSGVGKATALELAKRNNTVIMLCRNKERGESALNEIKELSGNDSVHLMICNLADLDDIREFCNKFKEKFGILNILINNAGVILPGRNITKNGFELQFGVNYLSHFLITNLLLETLEKGAPSRIVNVSSGIQKIGKIYFNDVNLKNNYKLWRAYAQSKLAMILFTYELSRRLQERGSRITVNCLHPGAVATKMGINRENGFGTFVTTFLKPFFQTPLKGAETSIFLATSPKVEGVSGKYFYKKKPITSCKDSYNIEIAKKLWDMSVDMTKLE